jgi:hypothetical protein
VNLKALAYFWAFLHLGLVLLVKPPFTDEGIVPLLTVISLMAVVGAVWEAIERLHKMWRRAFRGRRRTRR